MAGEAIEQSMFVNVGQQMPTTDRFFQEYNPSPVSYTHLGGIKTVAYKENSKRVYKAVYNFLYDHYDISEYADIPKVKYNEALSLIENWYPSYDLQLSIDISNNCKQQKMDLDSNN